MVWLPGARAGVVKVALPVVSRGAVPSVVEPSGKVTLPTGVAGGMATDLTEAASLTGVAAVEGLGDVVRVVVVELLGVVHVPGGV